MNCDAIDLVLHIIDIIVEVIKIIQNFLNDKKKR